MDDDLQHPPEEIPRLLTALEQGCDVVYGIPEKEQHGLVRDLASQLTKLALQHAMGAETARNVGAFRIFRTDVRNAFQLSRPIRCTRCAANLGNATLCSRTRSSRSEKARPIRV